MPLLGNESRMRHTAANGPFLTIPMTRNLNFSAGPSMLPLAVLERARDEMTDWNGMGASVMEISHRSAEFMELAANVESDLRELLQIPSNYRVLFTTGGATAAQALIPMNIASQGQAADYVVSGHWSHTAIRQATPYVDVRIAASSEPTGFLDFPDPQTWQWSSDSAYVHYTANETIHGVACRTPPKLAADAPPLVGDYSSSIASEPIDVSRFGILYAGAQKNLGPVGISVVIIREDLLERSGIERADIFRYSLQSERDSMLNTPPTFNWYLLGLTVRWMLDNGGTAAFKVRNERKAALLYETIDTSDGFYRNEIYADARSIMNVPFFLPNAELDARFVQASRSAGMLGLKGHKALGGIRASIYNAVPESQVDVLAQFMREFQRQHG